MTQHVLPPHAPTCAALSFPPPPPCARFVTAAVIVAGLTLPSALCRMLNCVLIFCQGPKSDTSTSKYVLTLSPDTRFFASAFSFSSLPPA
uniref:Uncharacterized protein n=1 Tax=Romanomermis culicivorax TaxID=13658 RepID=A0A915L673_ROMCU